MEEWKAMTAELRANYARCRSPSFEGVPTAPTAAANDNSRQLANTEYVNQAMEAFWNGLPPTSYKIEMGK